MDDATNRSVWSGTHYSIYRSLSKIAEVEILGPYEPELLLLFCKLLNQLSLLLLKKRFDYRHSFILAKHYGRYFTKKVSQVNPNLIVATAASSELAFLKTQVPIIYITDGTFASCLNYHKSLSNLLKLSINEGHAIEQLSVNVSKLVIVPSDWAAESVKNDYKAEQNKVVVMPLGANFEAIPADDEIQYYAPNNWKLLFVGVNWENKGGDIAFNAFKILMDKGYDVSLTILGCKPPSYVAHANLSVIPFIDKNEPAGFQRIKEIYKAHHLLIFPTRFDCAGIIINEASAFGIPSLVANTGGVGGHLKDGINGYLIDYNDSGLAYSEKIISLIESPEKYIALRKSSRKLFNEKLNWDSWLEGFKQLI